uniref:DAGKa domain-containing protein n=1 Tax=Macrostomum lignano TaxID=282301 RepID=A0A1I8F293_9PLAT
MRKFQWLLNPRQVLTWTACGGLAYSGAVPRAPNLRLLVCGGDGTTNLALNPGRQCHPALGTGNDWQGRSAGQRLADESLTKVLCCGTLASRPTPAVRHLRHLKTRAVASVRPAASECLQQLLQPRLPTRLLLLEFHESREANPERFNSRLRNMMFLRRGRSRSVITRQWRDLSQFVGLECDGTDYTDRIRELRATSILFLNIAKYSAGATPWGSPACSQGFEPQRHDDGSVEATVQMGGHGHRLCQCKTASSQHDEAHSDS